MAQPCATCQPNTCFPRMGGRVSTTNCGYTELCTCSALCLEVPSACFSFCLVFSSFCTLQVHLFMPQGSSTCTSVC